MKKILLNALVASSAMAAMAAAPQVPTYTEISMPTSIGGFFRGNNGVADLNGDGNLDIFIKGRVLPNWTTTLYYFTGDGYSFEETNTIPDVDGCSWERIITPIDFDADGDVDFILGASWGSKLLENDGAGNFTEKNGDMLPWELSIDGDDVEKWYDGVHAVADFNLDGYPDVVSFNGNPREDAGTPVIYINNGGDGTFTRDTDSGLQAQRGGTMVAGDINNDGKPDLVVVGWMDSFQSGNCIRAYYGNGDGTFTLADNDNFDIENRGTQNGFITLVDIDSDGDLDLFVTGESYPQGWNKLADLWINDGTGVFTLDTNVAFTGVKASGADWGDLNADGNMDLVYAGESADGAKTVVLINQGDGTFAQKEDLLLGHRGGAVVTVADVNSNNMMDIIVQGYCDAYSDGTEGGPYHAQVYNGLASRGMNTAPDAPSGLVAEANGDKVVFTWNAGSDSQTPVAALRYNVYVKLSNGKILSIIPADITTGKLRSIEVGAALTTCSYTLNVKADDIAEWGVQTIDGCKLGSEFAVSAEVSAIENIEIDNVEAAEYYNLQGVKVANPENGLYILKQGNKATKILVK